MKDIAITIITVDRTPRQNYLPTTIRNFIRGGVFTSPRFHSLHIADSGGHKGWPDRELAGLITLVDPPYPRRWIRAGAPVTGGQDVGQGLPRGAGRSRPLAPLAALTDPVGPGPVAYVYRTPVPRVACVNGSAALDAGTATDAAWILFCEDDLDVCGDFLDSVGRWLDLYGAPAYHVFPFGAAYPQVKDAAQRLQFIWEYPVGAFYGTQCVALRRAEAQSLADHWRTNPIVCDVHSPSAFDLMLAEWHQQKFPEQPYLLASAPSFVQHIGRESVATDIAQTHQFLSWPGPFWTFDPEVVRT